MCFLTLTVDKHGYRFIRFLFFMCLTVVLFTPFSHRPCEFHCVTSCSTMVLRQSEGSVTEKRGLFSCTNQPGGQSRMGITCRHTGGSVTPRGGSGLTGNVTLAAALGVYVDGSPVLRPVTAGEPSENRLQSQVPALLLSSAPRASYNLLSTPQSSQLHNGNSSE